MDCDMAGPHKGTLIIHTMLLRVSHGFTKAFKNDSPLACDMI